MNNFGTLYRYECKKLLGRKIVWISFSLCIAAIVISLSAPLLGDYYIDGKLIDSNYHMYLTDSGYAKAFSGREISQGLLEETITAYRKIPETPGIHYSSTEEYQRYARPYSEIFNFIRNAAGIPTSELMSSWRPREDDLYGRRKLWLLSLWDDLGLSKGEIDFWQKREARIKTPYVYEAHGGYDAIISSCQTAGLLVLTVIAICLSGMFSEEHTRKTDQIILCSPLGRTKLYWAKIAVGVSFAVINTALFFVFTSTAALCLYGTEGFHAAFQFIYAQNSDPVTCGQAVVIAYGNMTSAAVITSIIVIVLSELLRSNIAALAVSTGLLITAMIIAVPEQYRVLAQIWAWLPWCFLTPWNIFGQYTLSILGRHLTPWQAVPLIYFILSAVIAAVGRPVYERFQVSGR